MAGQNSFDIVSEVDMQEVDNAINQTKKEISQRYDFKNSNVEIELSKEDLKIVAEDEFKLNAVIEILTGKFIKRGLSPKALNCENIDKGSLGSAKCNGKIVKGISKEKAKEIVAFIKNTKVKVQAQIMDNEVRVTGKDRDDLQQIIALLKENDFDVALQFTNYRSK